MADMTHEVQPGSSAPEVTKQYYPSVYVEVSKEQLEMLEVGKTVNIKLLGKVKSLSANEQDSDDNRYEIQMELQEVKIDPEENEFTKLAEDD